MPYSVPTTFSAGSVLTAAQLNVIGGDIVDHESRINAMGLTLVTPTSVAGSGVSLTGGKVVLAAASTINVNGCFTSTYDHYRVIVTTTAASTSNLYRFRMRVGGVDASGATDYGYSLLQSASSGAWINLDFSAGTSSISVGYKTTADRTSSSIDVYGPALAEKTGFSVTGMYGLTPYTGGGSHILATAYDGFSVLPASGDITGSIRIYGYKNS